MRLESLRDGDIVADQDRQVGDIPRHGSGRGFEAAPADLSDVSATVVFEVVPRRIRDDTMLAMASPCRRRRVLAAFAPATSSWVNSRK